MVLHSNAQLGQEAGELVRGEVATLILIKCPKHISELKFFLLRVSERDQTLPHETENVHDLSVVYGGARVLGDFPHLLHNCGERVVIRALHRVVRHHLPKLLLAHLAALLVVSARFGEAGQDGISGLLWIGQAVQDVFAAAAAALLGIQLAP